MTNTSNYSSISSEEKDQSKYGNKKPYNNIQPTPEEELAPILVTAEIAKDKTLIKDNCETWHVHGHRIPVAFAPIRRSTLDGWMPFFWTQVRTYIATGGTSEFLSENGHEDDLSYDKFIDDAEAGEDTKGFDPGQTESLEDTVLMDIIIGDLIKEVGYENPRYGRILELICQHRTKGQILTELGLSKTQGYAEIKAAQALARKLYNRD